MWSVQPDRSWDYVNRGLVYLAFLALGVFVGALVPRATRVVAGGLAALLALVLAYALLAKGIPALYPDYERLARLRSPVGFWNALALLGDFALVLGLWRAAERRFDGVLLVFGGILTVLLAYSRGGVLIAVIAAAAWLVLDRRRFEALLALVLGGGAAVAVAGIALALRGSPTTDSRTRFASTTVGSSCSWSSSRWPSSPPRDGPCCGSSRSRRRAGARRSFLSSLIGLACAAGIGAAVVHNSGSTHASAAGEHCRRAPGGWPAAARTRGSTGGRRLCSRSRTSRWRARARVVPARPSSAPRRVHETGHRAAQLRPAELSENGIVGFLLLAGAVGFAVLAVRRRRRGRRGRRARGLRAGLSRSRPHRRRLRLRGRQRAVLRCCSASCSPRGTAPVARREPCGQSARSRRVDGRPLARVSVVARHKVDEAVAKATRRSLPMRIRGTPSPSCRS